ncbi:hypothetical protein, partial [Streptomyces albus]|uniref:hypothetical protein n=1 Tax=Streptomyces albus TaxID=1888 RepID=UPI001969C8BF
MACISWFSAACEESVRFQNGRSPQPPPPEPVVVPRSASSRSGAGTNGVPEEDGGVLSVGREEEVGR